MSEFKKMGQIIEGHFNKVLDSFGLLPDDIKMMATERFKQCISCGTTPNPKQPDEMGRGLDPSNNKCRYCTCDMEAKTKVIDTKCPIGRW